MHLRLVGRAVECKQQGPMCCWSMGNLGIVGLGGQAFEEGLPNGPEIEVHRIADGFRSCSH